MDANEEKIFIQYKCACALNTLLKRNKKINEKNKKKGIEDSTLNHSYEKISSSTGLRVATISDVFNGGSEVKIYTSDLIIKALGSTYIKFGRLMDSLNEEEVIEFIKRKEK